ncbi:MAG: colanic acid biosynthesis glycosyltransferase WcaL, partial [Cyanobacteria bacterium P01_D01_bin.44]
MKIAFFLGEFPAISQTFVLDQIVGLMRRGHAVDIFANVAKDKETLHPEIEKYRLLDRTDYWPKIPKNHLLRTAKGLKLVSLNLFKDPGLVLNSLNIFKYGKQA